MVWCVFPIVSTKTFIYAVSIEMHLLKKNPVKVLSGFTTSIYLLKTKKLVPTV